MNDRLSDKECMWICRFGIVVETIIAGDMIGMALKYQLYPHLPIVILLLVLIYWFYIWQKRLAEKAGNNVT